MHDGGKIDWKWLSFKFSNLELLERLELVNDRWNQVHLPFNHSRLVHVGRVSGVTKWNDSGLPLIDRWANSTTRPTIRSVTTVHRLYSVHINYTSSVNVLTYLLANLTLCTNSMWPEEYSELTKRLPEDSLFDTVSLVLQGYAFFSLLILLSRRVSFRLPQLQIQLTCQSQISLGNLISIILSVLLISFAQSIHYLSPIRNTWSI